MNGPPLATASRPPGSPGTESVTASASATPASHEMPPSDRRTLRFPEGSFYDQLTPLGWALLALVTLLFIGIAGGLSGPETSARTGSDYAECLDARGFGEGGET